MQIIDKEQFDRLINELPEFRSKRVINPKTLESTRDILVGRTRVACHIVQYIDKPESTDSDFISTYLQF